MLWPMRWMVLIALACCAGIGTAQAPETQSNGSVIVLNPSFEMDEINVTSRSSRVDATCKRREEVYQEVHQTQAQLARRSLAARLLPSLRVHWTFEDGDGTNVTDISGKGNAHATLKVNDDGAAEEIQPASWESSTLAGGSWAVRFRANTYLEGPTAASVGMSSTGARTVMAWIKLYDGVGGSAIVTYGSQALRHQFYLEVSAGRIHLDLSGTTEFGNNGDTVAPARVWSRSTYMTNTWHQVVVTYDGGQTDTSMTAYFDGVQTNQGRPTQTPLTSVNAPIYVHHDRGQNGGQADFYVDEVALFDTALTPYDVATLYNHGQGLGAPLRAGPHCFG